MDDSVLTHSVPVGGAVEFYCSDKLKRPKKDKWDRDAEDGIISAYCTQGGIMSISMNPGGKVAFIDVEIVSNKL